MSLKSVNRTKNRRRYVHPLWAVLIVSAIVLSGLLLISPLYGLSSDIVTSGSMVPTLRVGYVVIVHRTKIDQLKIGNIIVYRPTDPALGNVLLVHRIIAITTVNGTITGLITKGDANPYPDFVYGFEPLHGIPPGRVLGKVVMVIPYAGLILIYLGHVSGVEFFVSLLLLSVGFDLIRSSHSSSRSERNRAARHAIARIVHVRYRNEPSRNRATVKYRNLHDGFRK
jgi:signal peptidase